MSEERQCLNIELGMKIFESRGISVEDQKQVSQIKQISATLWSAINAYCHQPDNQEANRLAALAKTDLESSVMWAVKALSRKHDGS